MKNADCPANNHISSGSGLGKEKRMEKVFFVEEGKIFLVKLGGLTDFFKAFPSGEEIPDTVLKQKRGEILILDDGQEIIVDQETYNSGQTKKYTYKEGFRNVGGRVVVFDPEKNKKRDFAKKQAAIFQRDGLSEKEAWQIIKAAGPGAAVKAVEYAQRLLGESISEEEAWQQMVSATDPGATASVSIPQPQRLMDQPLGYKGDPESGLTHVDTLLVLFNQNGPAQTYLGWERAKAVLLRCGIEPPGAKNSKHFFRILQGARRYIHLRVQKKLRDF